MNQEKVNKMMNGYLEMFHSLETTIEQNIEIYRKGTINLNLRDKDGKSIYGGKVKIRQTRHDFTFGCNGLLLGQLGEANQLYEEEFAKLFNLVTTTFCWKEMEPTPGEYRFEEGCKEVFRRPPIDRVRNFCRKYNIRMKGQPLIADSWYPKWASKNPEELREQWKGYFEKIAERYGNDLYLCDVANEAYMCKDRTPDFPLYDEELSYVPWSFREAAKLFPKSCMLERNEASWMNVGPENKRYYEEIKELMNTEGVRIDSVGLQFHMFTGEDCVKHLRGDNLNLKELYQCYLRMSELGLPIFISEVTVPSNIPGCDRLEGEAIQAKVVECLYRLWFSIPSMRGIIYWNLKDGPAWEKEGDCLGCLLDSDMKEKPSYQTLYQFIHRRYSTSVDVDNPDREALSLRGFYGDYNIVVIDENGMEKQGIFSIKEGDSNVTVTVD